MDNLYLQKVLEGDISQFSYFINKYKDMAFSIAFRIINNNNDAEEIVQDSFLKAFNSLSKFKRDAKFSTWFYRIVVNNALSRLKKDRLDRENFNLNNYQDVIVEEVEYSYQKLTRTDQKKFINLVLQKMIVEDRLLLTLYYLNENSIEEINEITNISPENIKMKLHRARKKMYVLLENELKSEIKSLL